MIREINGYEVETDDLEMFDGETFKLYRERFLVSNYARCFDMENKRFIKDYNPKKGDYLLWYFSDFDDDEPVSKPIHRVVAELFCKKPDKATRLVVDHIDGDKHNNLSSNLRWLTYKENSNAQDVQKRKKESQAKTLEYKRNIESMVGVIADKDKQIEELNKEIERLQIHSKYLEGACLWCKNREETFQNEIKKLKKELEQYTKPRKTLNPLAEQILRMSRERENKLN